MSGTKRVVPIPEEPVINVKQKQKLYIHGAPESAPSQRPSENITYEQKYGKGPMMERQERLRRLQEIQRNMQPVG